MAVRVHLNCAMSLDGCIGLPGPSPLKLSGQDDMRRVHELRAANDAILVGVGTVRADNPKLTVKWDLLGRTGRQPLRVVLDAKLQTPVGSNVLDPSAPTLVFHGRRGGALPGTAQLAAVPADRHGFLDLGAVLKELEARKVRTLMVEGGSTVITSFLTQRLVDEFTLYVAPKVVGDPGAPRLINGASPDSLGLVCASSGRMGEGALIRWVRA